MSTPAACQDGREWDRARQQLMASKSEALAQAIDRWRQLTKAPPVNSFDTYAGFVLAYPDFPDEDKLRTYAEQALGRETPDLSRLVAFFDRFPPLTNPARARYALALFSLQRGEARSIGLQAWRGGSMSDASEAALFSLLGSALTPADHDARMNALLWAGDATAAARQMTYVSPAARAGFMARLTLVQGSAPGTLGLPVPGDALRDAGYVYASVRQAQRSGNTYGAVQLLATRPPATTPPLDPEKWIGMLLSVARGADSASATRIAASIDDTFSPGTDVSRMKFKLRDDYTSLMWLGGTRAMQQLGNPTGAAPLFYRYGAAAQTPQTRAKGFYWAGRALARAGDNSGANRYFEMAAAYPTAFYGELALERLGRPIPPLTSAPVQVPSQAERAAFNAKPITAAVREVARASDWQTTVRFFRAISDQAVSEGDHVLVADLATSLGRRDLGVILGQAAHAEGFVNLTKVAYPLLPAPAGTDWTMVHAISRQESQFSQNAVSHAGARGLMQLMPGTAREQAGKIGLAYDASALMADPSYNLRLGDAYFARMMDYFGGSYPLAVAAYNAGPGNVNKWLRNNGDPRTGSIEWVDWIEAIPLSETRNYVQRVLENAVVYEAMNPTRARYTGTAPLSHFIGKRQPG
ncbi:lytic transglycosylase domain-containing protein [Novosphingobium sp. G106]|uniref:lytic transglycosylase domain-containing protein n=1 Tax=Novosphingobium sp. G106 TaxID=2849500 RepID=UPI0020C234A9|nr:lytic transglycosylase domain-containing protein [Novosphingobium sp. G106]